MLTLESQHSVEEICRQLKDLPKLLKNNLPEKALQINSIKDTLTYFNELLTKPTATVGGWSIFAKPQVLIEHIGRDEFKLEESKVWSNFKVNEILPLQIVGVFLVPGKILVGVGKPIDDLI
jgi:hypothetical protein